MKTWAITESYYHRYSFQDENVWNRYKWNRFNLQPSFLIVLISPISRPHRFNRLQYQLLGFVYTSGGQAQYTFFNWLFRSIKLYTQFPVTGRLAKFTCIGNYLAYKLVCPHIAGVLLGTRLNSLTPSVLFRVSINNWFEARSNIILIRAVKCRV